MNRFFLFFCCLFSFTCENDQVLFIASQLRIQNAYESNGLDHYQGEIEVNFKLEATGWLWEYEGHNRPKIYNSGPRDFTFTLPEQQDSVYIHARFFYEEGIEIKYIYADTTLRMNENKWITFWNCGDTTTTEYPFPACFEDSTSLLN